MDRNELSVTLRDSAVSIGLCDAWRNGWRDNATKQELLSKYIRGVDFCLQHKWPANEFLVENFGTELLEKNAMWINDNKSMKLDKAWNEAHPLSYVVVLGTSTATFRVDVGAHPRFFVGDDANIKIVVHTNEDVMVEVRDRAQVEIITDPHYKGEIKVWDYSAVSIVIAPESVKYITEKDYLHE